MISLNHTANLPSSDRQRILLHLYVTGTHTLSRESRLTVRQLCEVEFGGQYELVTIDLQAYPREADVKQILVTPTLMRVHPGPERRLIGDLSDSNAMRQVLQSWLEEVECHFEC